MSRAPLDLLEKHCPTLLIHELNKKKYGKSFFDSAAVSSSNQVKINQEIRWLRQHASKEVVKGANREQVTTEMTQAIIKEALDIKVKEEAMVKSHEFVPASSGIDLSKLGRFMPKRLSLLGSAALAVLAGATGAAAQSTNGVATVTQASGSGRLRGNSVVSASEVYGDMSAEQFYASKVAETILRKEGHYSSQENSKRVDKAPSKSLVEKKPASTSSLQQKKGDEKEERKVKTLDEISVTNSDGYSYKAVNRPASPDHQPQNGYDLYLEKYDTSGILVDEAIIHHYAEGQQVPTDFRIVNGGRQGVIVYNTNNIPVYEDGTDVTYRDGQTFATALVNLGGSTGPMRMIAQDYVPVRTRGFLENGGRIANVTENAVTNEAVIQFDYNRVNGTNTTPGVLSPHSFVATLTQGFEQDTNGARFPIQLGNGTDAGRVLFGRSSSSGFSSSPESDSSSPSTGGASSPGTGSSTGGDAPLGGSPWWRWLVPTTIIAAAGAAFAACFARRKHDGSRSGRC